MLGNVLAPSGQAPCPKNGTKAVLETFVKERVTKATELMTAPGLGDGEKNNLA